MAIVTLITDFGTADGYVGAIKGVIHRLSSRTVIVDIAHDVPRHDVAHAAWVLTTAAKEFPRDTVHVVIVDPGVGGGRGEVVVACGGHFLVGPDNGVFAPITAGGHDGAWAITAPRVRAAQVSATFHGRDVFAPAAAALSRGLTPDHVGLPVTLAGVLPWPASAVIHVDRYGNLISDVVCPAGASGTVTIAGRTVALASTYEDVASGALVAYAGSAGTVEVAVRDGDAAKMLKIGRGAPVVLELS